jgi:uncharacterized protein (DUF58 family)
MSGRSPAATGARAVRPPLRPVGAVRGFFSGLTVRGYSFFSAGVGSTVAAIFVGYQPLLRVGVLLIAVPIAAAAVTTASRYRISCQRTLDPARVPVGSYAHVGLHLRNAARLASSPLLIEDRVPYTLGSRPRFVLRRIEPYGRREVRYRMRTDNRGQYTIGPLTVRSADPLGLFELTRSFSAQHTLTVAPHVDPLPAILLGTVWTGHGDGHATHAAAAGEDDVGVREYRYGDELRRIHWKATAHHGEMMVRREELNWHSRCSVVLDDRVGAHQGTGPASSLEWAISAAASCAVHLLHQGYTVRLSTVAAAGEITADSEDEILESLAVLRPVHASSVMVRQNPEGESDGLVVAVLGELGTADATELVRGKPGKADAIAFLLDTRTWAGAPDVVQQDGPDPAAVLLEAGGWRVVHARVSDRFPDLWRAAARHSAAPESLEAR